LIYSAKKPQDISGLHAMVRVREVWHHISLWSAAMVIVPCPGNGNSATEQQLPIRFCWGVPCGLRTRDKRQTVGGGDV